MNIKKIILASTSKARQDLLRQAGIEFDVVKINVEEIFDPNIDIEELVLKNAKLKANALQIEGSRIILAADTLVTNRFGNILCKPESYDGAFQMIKSLNGWSSVYTGFCLQYKNGNQISNEYLEVVGGHCFIEINDQEIRDYLKAINCFKDLAGGLNVEGYGSRFVKEVKGSYAAILGLPIFEVYKALKQINKDNN